MHILIFVGGAFLAGIAYWYWYVYKFFGKLAKVPGPITYPLVGSGLDFLDPKGTLDRLIQYQEKYGTMVKAMLGPMQPVIMVTDTRMLQSLLNSVPLIDKSTQYRFLHKWLGSGLFTSQAERWKRHRKLLTPAFHFKILEEFTDVFDSQTVVMVERLSREVGKKSVDIYPYVTLCALDIICETSMGTSINAQSDTESEYVYSVKQMCRMTHERTTNPLKNIDALFWLTKDAKIEQKAVDVLHRHTDKVIRNRKQTKLPKSDSILEDGDGKKRKLALLDLLLEYNMRDEPLISEKEIREEVDTFMFGGHDTTASGVSFALFAIAHHQDVQEKIVEELKAIFVDDFHRPATYRDLTEMKYMEAVIKETLRLYPTAPFHARRVPEDMECDGLMLPKDLTVAVFLFGLHRRPDLHPDPLKFDPERFTNNKTMPPYTYLPFTAGQRNCIGQKYAMLEMKSMLARVLRHYKLLPAAPVHKLRLVAEVVLKSDNGMRISIEHRKL